MQNTDVLITILSIGFVILIIFVCVALGAMIKIMLDLRRITEMAKREIESISEVFDVMGDKAKSFLTNSLVLEKIVPAILGAITIGASAKKAMEHYEQKTGGKAQKKGKKMKNNIFAEEEID